MPTNLLTLRDHIEYATERFSEANLYFGHGTDNAWDEAVALVLHALHLPHYINPSVLDARITQEQKQRIMELIELRVEKRLPVPYLTHEAWFSGMSFYVDERVLIPRSPIAELIENRFAPWINPDNVQHILDLCTGSACIGIVCAKYFPAATVDVSDISADALEVAKMNVVQHKVENQVHLHKSDLFESLPKTKYDVIVSNPPYVSQQEMDELPNEYNHEPTLALVAGATGLDFARRILSHASDYLAPHGILIVEVGNSEIALAEAYPQVPFTWLEFERGGGGVFLLTKDQLDECGRVFY